MHAVLPRSLNIANYPSVSFDWDVGAPSRSCVRTWRAHALSGAQFSKQTGEKATRQIAVHRTKVTQV